MKQIGENRNQDNCLSWRIKIGYGVASMGDACTYTVIGTFLMFFLTTVVEMNPITAGAIAAMGAIWDAICSPLIGYLSDNVRTQYGRRLPFLFFAAFPLGISCAMLFNSIDADYTFKLAYYGIMVILFWTSFSLFFVPYMALGAELTDNYNERTSLRSIAYSFSLCGMVIGMVSPTIIVDFLMNSTYTVEQAWSGTGLFIGAITILVILFTCVTLKSQSMTKSNKIMGTEKVRKSKKKLWGIIKEYWQVLCLKPTKFLLLASISYLIASTMNYSDRMYFMTYILDLEAGLITVVLFIAIASGALFIPIINKASAVYDKRSVYIGCMGIGAGGAVFAQMMEINSLFGLGAFLFFFACANSAYWQLLPAMIYDVCEVDELVYGQRREGSIISLQALSESLASAISMQMLGIILASSGFDSNAKVQSQITNDWIENMLTFIPAIFMAISVIMVIQYPITKKVFKDLTYALDQRKRGEEVDLEKLKHLI